MAEGLVLHEQRGLTRRELIYYLKISDRKSGREIARMGDLHTEGMLALSEKPLVIGEIHNVSLELPKALHDSGRTEVFITFEVMWSRPGPKSSSYKENGVRFVAPDHDQKQVINQLIELFAMPPQ
ncbi:MAG: PilZ domain-containing protein [Candidatus Adiutrix sp.]|jgi:hypothetical protein|nr:PilZ domain-containing protein [Candidatus Adiutrix sp.]